MTEQTQQVAAPQVSAAQLVAAFIALRDKKAEMAERHKVEMKPLSDALASLDTALLALCKANGTDAVKIKGIGSATTAVKTSASLEDPEAFRAFVVANQNWEMANWSANTEAVLTYSKENGKLPPGVKVSAYEHMNVRRATKTE